jgi:uncharacterized protein (DUF1786 family)
MADLFDKEVVMAAGATAALMSERARRVLRRGAVYGIAGVMSAGEAVTAAARSVGHDGERVSAGGDEQPATVPRPTPARRPKTTTTT